LVNGVNLSYVSLNYLNMKSSMMYFKISLKMPVLLVTCAARSLKRGFKFDSESTVEVARNWFLILLFFDLYNHKKATVKKDRLSFRKSKIILTSGQKLKSVKKCRKS